MMNHCRVTRRSFIKTLAATPLILGARENNHTFAASLNVSRVGERRYHLCLSSQSVDTNPALLKRVLDAGVTDIWQAAYLYGHWYETPDKLALARKKVEDAGLRWHLINVPLGHPGDSLGAPDPSTPLNNQGAWRDAQRPDGSLYSGTSLHEPATRDNVAALQELAHLQPDMIFLDDDFRLATGPGVIGGCFCDEHRQRFLNLHGYNEKEWKDLLTSINERKLSPVLREWVEFTCDELTTSFRAQQAAVPQITLGNMIMYLGAEKAGIRLKDYRDAPFRVGELMFDDKSFSPVKGKTDELFSALFHRRFAKRELSYSESTAFPHDQLSAKNMAAKLAISTISDVPNTMFMSGLTPFPEAHWDTLGPAMRRHSDLHSKISGHTPRGPMKHYWGEASRYVGDDRPFSLFLALGIPFEVHDVLPDSGLVFLSDQDAQHLTDNKSNAVIICRKELGGVPVSSCTFNENLEELWPLKHELLNGQPSHPYVVEDLPIVCAWYPTANCALVWNLSEIPVDLNLRFQAANHPLRLGALDLEFVPL